MHTNARDISHEHVNARVFYLHAARLSFHRDTESEVEKSANERYDLSILFLSLSFTHNAPFDPYLQQKRQRARVVKLHRQVEIEI